MATRNDPTPPPALKWSYPSKAEAIAAIEVRGFKNSGPAFPQFWTKPSTNTFGAPMLAIIEIVEQVVDPKWNKPNYFEVQFR